MEYYQCSNPQSRFPKTIKPVIFHRSDGEYYSFSIKNLYSELFVKIRSYETTPYITDPEALNIRKSENKQLLSFLLPQQIAEAIELEGIKEYDCHEYLVQVHRNNRISKLLAKVFAGKEKCSGKHFAEAFRDHFVTVLKDAKFSREFPRDLVLFADTVIVPEAVSKSANKAFHSLIDSGKHDSISKAIGNIFACAMLGLFAMKYLIKDPKKNESSAKDGVIDQTGTRFCKTYLLNRLGMEYIWTPELITDPYEDLCIIEKSYNYGHYKTAYQGSVDWFKTHKSKASEADLAKAYMLRGFSLYNLANSDSESEFKGKEKESIDLLKECIDTGGAEPVVYYFLYDYCKENDSDIAYKYLKTAFERNYANAVTEVALLSLNAEIPVNGIDDDVLLEKLNYIIDHSSNNTAVEVGECYYFRGRIEKGRGNISQANRDFAHGAKLGNENARQEVSRNKRMNLHNTPFFQPSAAYRCFANTLTGYNLTVLSTFPTNKWSLYTTGETIRSDVMKYSDVSYFIDSLSAGNFAAQKIVFLFMSEDEEKNLNECLILLDKLFNVVLGLTDSQQERIIGIIDIFVKAPFETASILIDANVSDMGKNIYFKVHITDENRDCVHRLLCEAPLFLPMLNRIKRESASNVILFGGSEMNYTFVKESMACAYMGKKHPISVSVLAPNADKLQGRFRQECPGVFSDYFHIDCIRPKFINCNIDETDFPKFIYSSSYEDLQAGANAQRKPPFFDITEALAYGNYFIVDVGNDLQNIKFATELRTWLLRSRGSFDRAPFIAVKCSNERNSYLAAHLTLSGCDAGNSYYNRYDLFPIGVCGVLYSYDSLIENPVLSDFAFRIHNAYHSGTLRESENDFYSYSYNADSSLATAIGLCYRFFASDVYYDDWKEYANFKALTEPELIKEFKNKLNNEKKEYLGYVEQSRWNSFMLSRGWESADENEVQAYKEQSTGSAHKHILAKMHPFIREWDDLDDPELGKVRGILKTRYNYDKHPKNTTIKGIEDTVKFFV